MEEGPTSTSDSSEQASLEQQILRRGEEQSSTGLTDPHTHQPIAAAEDEEEASTPIASAYLEDRTQDISLQDPTIVTDQDKGKEKETGMSYPGDYHYSRMSAAQGSQRSSASDRRPDMSRSGASSGSSSNASTPRQGTDAARDNKKDDRSSGSGASGNGSSTGSGSGSGGSSRSRLVAGVFVRY
jgi:hypothetical protein